METWATVGKIFVGRDRELALLHAVLDDARAGAAQIAIVEGAAGYGKTTLVRRLIEDAGDAEILWASADEDETALTNGFVTQLVAGEPDLPEPFASLADAEPPDPLFVGASLLDVLGRAERDRPLLVVAEDVHFADEPSVRALCFAAKRLRHDHVLVVLTVREGIAPEAVSRLIGSPNASHVTLGGFAADDVRELARLMDVGDVEPRDAERLRAHCDGNPLHIQTLLAEVSVEELRAAVDEPLRAPRSFAHLVLGQLARCTSDAVHLAQAASVLGTSSAFADACALAGLSGGTEAPVASLVTARVVELRESTSGRVLTFVHPLVRAAIYHDLGPDVRTSLHSRAVEIAPSDDARLRHRVAAADGPDSALADELEAQALDRAEGGDWYRAGCVYAQASELAVAIEQRERTHLRALHAFTVSGDRLRAAELEERAESFEDTVLRRFVVGSLQASNGQLAEGAELLRSAIELGRATNDPLVAPITAHLALAEMFLLQIDESNRHAREALTSDTSHWSVDTYGGAEPLNILLGAYATEGRFAEGLEAAEHPPDGGPPPGVDRADGLVGRGTIRLFADDPRGAHDDFTMAAEHYRRRGPAAIWCMSLLQLARCEYALGEWDEAVAHANLAISIGEDSGLGTVLPLAYATTVQVLAARGAWAEAEGRVNDARALGGAGVALDTAGVSALLARARGDDEGVAQNLYGYVTLAKMMPGLPGGAAYTCLSAEAHVELDRLDEAAEAIAGLRDPDEATPAVRFLAARTRARLLAAQGHVDEADREFQLALERGVDLTPCAGSAGPGCARYGQVPARDRT